MMKKLLASCLIVLLSLSLAACGFTPMRGAQNRQALSVGVSVDASPKDEDGRELEKALEDRLNLQGLPSHPAYKLSVVLTSALGGIGVARDGTVSRFNVTLTSNYVLTRLADDKIIQRGEIRHVSSFNNQTNQYFSTYISEKDSIKRGIAELSELYRQRIGALLLKQQPV
ncbi:MAG: hypothetical protein SFX19_07400 [Alphaproteobacteria bacterium]|nr:hypothetical protein [Alphaproteobacteria bacterium]